MSASDKPRLLGLPGSGYLCKDWGRLDSPIGLELNLLRPEGAKCGGAIHFWFFDERSDKVDDMVKGSWL